MPIVKQSLTIAYLVALRPNQGRKGWSAQARLAEKEPDERRMGFQWGGRHISGRGLRLEERCRGLDQGEQAQRVPNKIPSGGECVRLGHRRRPLGAEAGTPSAAAIHPAVQFGVPGTLPLQGGRVDYRLKV